MEVLISTFVLSIGLLGLAALIPVGRFAIVQTAKSDRAGACGRAGLREVKVRRMVDFTTWAAQPSPGQPFAIDPLGLTNGLPTTFGPIPRINLKNPQSGAALNGDQAQAYFMWPDDKVFNVPDNPALRTRAQYHQADGSIQETITNQPAVNGHYSWFCTVVPAVSEAQLPPIDKTLFTVSVAVCYRRSYTTSPPAGERPAEVSATATFVGNMPVYPGGGSLTLDRAVAVKENDWIMLYAAGGGSIPPQCKWYRVVGVAEDPADTSKSYLTVAGPDWYATGTNPTAVIVDSVIGVYTETVELDSGPWNRR